MKSSYLLLSIVLVSISFCNKNFYFNPENDWGSDSYFNPINAIINGSYDILRNGNMGSKNFLDLPYLGSNDNIVYNITNPIDNIKKFGVKNFIELEIFNLSLDPKKGHFLPNIANHVIGNGMLNVKLKEWYKYHKYPYPSLMAISTTTFYQYMNEIVEHHAGTRYVNVDSISDLLIFNPLGLILFNFDFTNKLFTEITPVYDWSLQPIINPTNASLENAGQNYIMQFPFLRFKNFQPFIYWGIHGIVGISYKQNNNHTFSVGLGRVVNRIKSDIKIDSFLENTIFFTPEMDGALSFFWDKNNSLLLSTLITGPRFYNMQINIYPGVLKLKSFSPGIYCAFGKTDGFVMGVTLNFLPIGIGISL